MHNSHLRIVLKKHEKIKFPMKRGLFLFIFVFQEHFFLRKMVKVYSEKDFRIRILVNLGQTHKDKSMRRAHCYFKTF